jgi:hypothetical protein
MAADKIVSEFRSFLNFANDGFKYNLQVFPDTITAGALLFALLFQSPQMGAFGGSMALLNFIHPTFAGFLGTYLQDVVEPSPDTGACTGYFPGVSYERLLGATQSKSMGSIAPAWPSFYSTFLGFLAGWVGLLPSLYSRELEASQRRKAAATTGIVILSIVILLCVVYRLQSGCDKFSGLAMGMLVGAGLGVVMCYFLSWITDRRITNIMNMPLIRERVPDGKPIYVCERPSAAKKTT